MTGPNRRRAILKKDAEMNDIPDEIDTEKLSFWIDGGGIGAREDWNS